MRVAVLFCTVSFLRTSLKGKGGEGVCQKKVGKGRETENASWAGGVFDRDRKGIAAGQGRGLHFPSPAVKKRRKEEKGSQNKFPGRFFFFELASSSFSIEYSQEFAPLSTAGACHAVQPLVRFVLDGRCTYGSRIVTK